MDADPTLLTTEEVAHQLGVKPATVYAYVSRGLLTSRRNADGKGSLFTKPDVDAFVAGRRRPTTPGIQTGITLIRDGSLYYRGRDACALARTSSFEAVATLLWAGDLTHMPLIPNPTLRQLAIDVTSPLPRAARLTDRLRVIVAAAAAADPLRFDISPAAVMSTGRTLLSTMVTALPAPVTTPTQHADEESGAAPLAHTLWHRLTQQQPPPTHEVGTTARALRRAGTGSDSTEGGDSSSGLSASGIGDSSGSSSGASGISGDSRGLSNSGSGGGSGISSSSGISGISSSGISSSGISSGYDVLNSALVLLADHDLAASTLAARVAASTRAHPYAVVSAGLAALDGPLHGAASGLAYALIAEAMTRGKPVDTIADRLRAGGVIPGFGHRLYPDGDPRAGTLLELLGDGPVRQCVDALAATMRARSGAYPNIDLAIAAMALQYDMGPDAGEAIFAVARTAGWLAHALEEYSDRPSRFRPDGQYAGRKPPA